MVAMLAACAAAGLAQEQTTSITGSVTDPAGLVVAAVPVVIAAPGAQQLTATTDGSGYYRFPSIPPGTYVVSSSAKGLHATVPGIIVTLGRSARVDLVLQRQEVAASIDVTARPPVIDLTSSAASSSIRRETFNRLPHSRDLAGIVTEAAAASLEPKAGGISIDGASGSENRTIIDGIDTTQPRSGTSGKMLIPDFIDEVEVKSSGYEAEFGGAVGGVINVVTRSGTDQLRGSAFAYGESGAWDGAVRRSPATDATGRILEYVHYRRDGVRKIDPGFTIGGAIVPEHLWFFAGYQPQLTRTSRTVAFIDGVTGTYLQNFRRNNYAGTLSGVFGSRWIFRVSATGSPEATMNTLPDVGGHGVSSHSAYDGRRDALDDRSLSGYVDFLPRTSLLLSARGGQWFTNTHQSGYASDPQINFNAGSPSLFPDVPADLIRPVGFSTGPSPSSTAKDAYWRNALALDASWFPGGSHQVKAGVQLERLRNEVNSGNQSYVIDTFWGGLTQFATAAEQGPYGMTGVWIRKTFGSVESRNTALFVQDAWTTLRNRLTINYGLRTESETIPDYADPSLGLRRDAIRFGFGDKLAPRLGFAFDLRGDGRSKVYGSWGRYYDITKLSLSRSAFGGEKYIYNSFAIDDPNWTHWVCTNVTTTQNPAPTCTGMTWQSSVDLRRPSLNAIDPNLKPMESVEYVLGMEQALATNGSVGLRLLRKHLVRAVEDVGVLVKNPDGTSSEDYFIANPGFGVAKYTLGTSLPAQPRAKRDYDALELEMSQHFPRWDLHASYVFSRLWGNYPGLASSDEGGRTAPNVERAFDNLFSSFDEQGRPVYGRLGTDRPHRFEAQLRYRPADRTSIGLVETVASGTPISTQVLYEGVGFFPLGRGNLGRTPWISQTDLLVQHEWDVRGGTLQLGLNVLNLFDAATATTVANLYSGTSIDGVSHQQFFQGFDALAHIPDPAANKAPSYDRAIEFQLPREIFVNAKLSF